MDDSITSLFGGIATAMMLRPCMHEMYDPRNGKISHLAQLPDVVAMSWTRCIVMLLHKHNPPMGAHFLTPLILDLPALPEIVEQYVLFGICYWLIVLFV
jgi:hypothetical protein